MNCEFKKILFISYYFAPYPTVASLRNTYWAENIYNEDNKFSASVLTATPRGDYLSENIEDVTYLRDTKKGGLFSKLIKDEGVSWKKDIKKYVSQNPQLRYDFVVITGGPFMHFGIAKFLKKKWNCKVVLDYRDPFAYNPKFNSSKLKDRIKAYFEKKFNRYADSVITINPSRAEIICCENKEKIAIIDNGYNEKQVDAIREENDVEFDKNKIHTVYTGRLYEDSYNAISNFCSVISETEFKDKWSFRYMGQNCDEVNSLTSGFEGEILTNDIVPYDQMTKILDACTVGLIFTGGTALESPTKIFDYIGVNKPILIITSGIKEYGNLGEIARGIDNVWWSSAEKDEIHEILSKMSDANLETDRLNREDFSRKAGLKKLIQLLK